MPTARMAETFQDYTSARLRREGRKSCTVVVLEIWTSSPSLKEKESEMSLPQARRNVLELRRIGRLTVCFHEIYTFTRKTHVYDVS